jgi:hypothetical protein
MKYYLLLITETIDGYEVNHKTVFAAKNQKEHDKKMDSILRNQRDPLDRADDEGYWFENDCIKVEGYTKEIPQADFEVLTKYI